MKRVLFIPIFIYTFTSLTLSKDLQSLPVLMNICAGAPDGKTYSVAHACENFIICLDGSPQVGRCRAPNSYFHKCLMRCVSGASVCSLTVCEVQSTAATIPEGIQTAPTASPSTIESIGIPTAPTAAPISTK